MADKHPYTSGLIGISQAVAQLRKSFPAVVNADTLKKLGISPNNEGYLINVLKFVGVVDGENKKTATTASIFNKHDDGEFQQGFSELVKAAYHELFDLHGDAAWGLPINSLIGFFRNHDGTSDIVGKRQAATFQTLAALAGKAPAVHEGPLKGTPKVAKSAKPSKPAAKAPSPKIEVVATSGVGGPSAKNNTGAQMALTVRVEINLPAGGDKQTYDAIFKSLRENLLNGPGA